MECVEAAALKTSLRKETPLKSSTPQAVLEDIWVVNNAQNGVSCDDFSVDDLFDFTNGDAFLEQVQQHEHEHEHEVQEQQQEEASSHKRQKLSEEQDQEQHFSDEIVKFSDQELAVPADDVANLEWLSHFIEDSFSEHSSAVYPAGMLTATPKLPEPEKPVPTSHKTPVPGKARSKRTRTGGRVWSLVGTPPVTDSSSSSTSSSSSSLSGSGSGSVSGSSSAPWFLCSNSVLNSDSIFEVNGTAPVSVEKKKHKKRPVATELTGGNVTQPTRRCSHCGVTKTPQWRAGPMGAKTLCNACGVRFKSGRLLPEYRPACSPTFSTELHSNHHRKVIEMRRKKEGLNEAEPGSVPNFG